MSNKYGFKDIINLLKQFETAHGKRGEDTLLACLATPQYLEWFKDIEAYRSALFELGHSKSTVSKRVKRIKQRLEQHRLALRPLGNINAAAGLYAELIGKILGDKEDGDA